MSRNNNTQHKVLLIAVIILCIFLLVVIGVSRDNIIKKSELETRSSFIISVIQLKYPNIKVQRTNNEFWVDISNDLDNAEAVRIDGCNIAMHMVDFDIIFTLYAFNDDMQVYTITRELCQDL